MGLSGRVYSCTCLMRLMLGQVVVWVELPVQRRLCLIFMSGVGLPDIHDIPQVDGLSTDTPILGRHNLVSELRYTST